MTDKKAVKWLSQTVGKSKGNIVLLALLQAIANGGAVCYALVMKNMVDNAVDGNRTGFITGLVSFGLLMLFFDVSTYGTPTA